MLSFCTEIETGLNAIRRLPVMYDLTEVPHNWQCLLETQTLDYSRIDPGKSWDGTVRANAVPIDNRLPYFSALLFAVWMHDTATQAFSLCLVFCFYEASRENPSNSCVENAHFSK